jgi:hypothetical protein
MHSLVHPTRASLRSVMVIVCVALFIALPYIIKTFLSETDKIKYPSGPTNSPQEDVPSTEQSNITSPTIKKDAASSPAASEQDSLPSSIEANNLQPASDSNVHVQEEVSPTQSEAESAPTIEAYCMKCRQKRSMLLPRQITTKNGRHAMEGICPVCNTRLFRFISLT